MAKLSVDGLDALMLSLQEIASLPDDVADEMLTAGAEIAAKEIRIEAAKLGIDYDAKNRNSRDNQGAYDRDVQKRNYATGTLARSVKIRKMQKKGTERRKIIYFSGSRKRGNTVTKNSEIAFMNEYGSRHVNARNFVWSAIERVKDVVLVAQAKIYDDFLKSKNL